MLNYLSIFLLFVKYCYLVQETSAVGNEMERMIAAVADARKAFTPAATEDYRKQAVEMLGRVPTNDQVRDRYKRTLKLLTDNLSANDLPYKTQQVLNFFLLQGRINTRLGKDQVYVVIISGVSRNSRWGGGADWKLGGGVRVWNSQNYMRAEGSLLEKFGEIA